MRVTWLAVLVACKVPAIDLAGKSCPCVAGYQCDTATNTCVPPGSDAPIDTASDAGAMYRDVVLADSPIGYWRLGDIGAIARDELGLHDGMYSGSCTQGVAGAIAGDANTAVTFDGGSCKVTMPVAFAFAGTAAFSVEAWVQTTANTQFQMVLSDETRNATNPIDGYALLVVPIANGGGPSLERVISQAGVKTPVGLLGAGFEHVVATYDGAHVALYVNGAFSGQAADARAANTITQVAIIGAASVGNYFAGTLDEVALYGTALAADRIAAHHQAGAGP